MNNPMTFPQPQPPDWCDDDDYDNYDDNYDNYGVVPMNPNGVRVCEYDPRIEERRPCTFGDCGVLCTIDVDLLASGSKTTEEGVSAIPLRISL